MVDELVVGILGMWLVGCIGLAGQLLGGAGPALPREKSWLGRAFSASTCTV